LTVAIIKRHHADGSVDHMTGPKLGNGRRVREHAGRRINQAEVTEAEHKLAIEAGTHVPPSAGLRIHSLVHGTFRGQSWNPGATGFSPERDNEIQSNAA